MEILKSRSILILFTSIISVSALIDNPLLKYLSEHRDKCTLHEIKDAEDRFLICTTDMQNKVKAMPKPIHRFDYDMDAKQLCTLDMTKCWSEMGKALKNCLGGMVFKEYFETPIKIIRRGEKYACANQGKALQDFLDHGLKCLNESKQTLQGCGQLFTEFGQKYFDKQFRIEETCKDISKIGSCIVDALDTCKDKTATNFLRKLLHESFYGTECQETMVAAFPDSSSSLSAFNLLLVVAGMVSLLVNS